MRRGLRGLPALCVVCGLLASVCAADEVILQYFNTSWAEIARRIPELAEAGYTALWLPPPFKAGGGLSVGFDCYDRFDLGTKNQNGSVTTKYGTETELLHMMEVAHRFGFRVYFDNVMAHNGGPMSSGAPGTLQANGFVPEDFHLHRTSETTYENWDWPNWEDEWQVLNRNPFGQDIAQEGSPNTSFGYNENDDYPKWSGIRHAGQTELYLDTDLPLATNYEGQPVYTFANKEPYEDTNSNGRFDWTDTNPNGQHDAGEPSEPFTDTGLDPSRTDRWTAAWGYGNGKYDMGNVVSEDVNGLLNRSIRWFTDKASPDGFRLDAVKHVPAYFFGKLDNPKDGYSWGYCGQAQEQFNISRGFSDWDNHRDTVFNNIQPRDDLLMYGEHLGSQWWWTYKESSYIDAGLRIANDDFLNSIKGNIGSSLEWMDSPTYGVINPQQSMHYVMSHDNNYLWDGGTGWGGDREQAHAVLLAREGELIVYTDGYNQSGSPDWFPKPALIPFLGQFGQSYIPNLLDIRRHFGWGYHSSRWSAWDYTSWSRYDPGATGGGNNDHGVTMVFMMAKKYVEGTWPVCNVDAVFPEGARLFNYSYRDGAFKAQVLGGKIREMDGDAISVEPGKYYVFSWRNPEMPWVWGEGLTEEVQPILIYENGQRVGTVAVPRRDGRNGDPAFNPYGLADADTGDYTYTIDLPRVTSPSNLALVARADGSAENILMKLDGGIDLNSQMDHVTQDPGTRDNPPAAADDKFLGYEQMKYVQRVAEKFAATDTVRNTIGSPGSETYICTISSNGFVINPGGGPNHFNTGRAVMWHFHDPNQDNQFSTDPQFDPPPQSAAGQPVTIWTKIGYAPNAEAVWLYYTTNGTDWPEGSAGVGKGSTLVIPLAFATNGTVDGDSTSQWWTASLPAMPSNTVLRYKIGACKLDAASLFPWSDDDIDVKRRMETVFQITNFNAGTVPYYPHNDWGRMAVGLDEGFHVLRTKAILGRAAGDTPIFRERTQTFYCDTVAPTGRFLWPPADGWVLSNSTYGVVARSDMTVDEAWYRIEDTDPDNDDTATGVNNGNNAWVKAGQNIVTAPMPGQMLEREWRFNYVNIPTSGTAVIKVRLRETTSSTNMSDTDAEGHFTTLTRTVTAGGSGSRFFVATPAADGAVVGVGSNFATHFSKELANGWSDAELRTAFVIRINGTAQSNTSYVITRDVSSLDHAVSLALPNLYNGQPTYQHVLSTTFTRDGYPELVAQRWVLAEVDDDSNDDGIPDAWEQKWGAPVGSIAPGANDDGDPFVNSNEYVANTNPFDSNDFLRVDGVWPPPSTPLGLEFTGQSNRNYFVWYREDPLDATNEWQRANPLTSPIEGEGRRAEYLDTTAGRTGRFYRVEVKLP